MTDFFTSLDRALEPEPHTSRWVRDYDAEVDPHTDWGLMLGSPEWQRYLDSAIEPVAYDGFGAPLYAHQLPAEGTE